MVVPWVNFTHFTINIGLSDKNDKIDDNINPLGVKAIKKNKLREKLLCTSSCDYDLCRYFI